LEAAPEAKDLGGLVGQVPNSAQALKVTYPNEPPSDFEEEEEGGGRGGKKGQIYCVKRAKLAHVLPEYHLLCVGSQLKDQIRHVESVLEGLNSMSSFDLDPGSPVKNHEDDAEKGEQVRRGELPNV